MQNCAHRDDEREREREKARVQEESKRIEKEEVRR